MSILGANFKIYNPFMKQPIGYKLLFFSNMILIVALYAASVFITVIEIGFPFDLLILLGLLLFFLGQMITVVQIDILSKPFSFCLPNHNKIPRQIIFLIGIGVAVTYSIALLQLPFDTESKRLMIITGPVIVLTFYFLPVCLTLYLQDEKPNQFVMLSFVLLVVLVWITSIKHDYFEYMSQELISFCFVPLLVSLIALVTAAWKMLGEPDLKRKSHGKDSKMMVAFYTRPLNRDTWDDVIRTLRLSKKPKQENDKLDTILDKMKSRPYFSISRSFLGNLYSLISYGFSYSSISPIKHFITIIALGSIVLIFSGYQIYGVMRFFPESVSLNWVQMTVLICIGAMFEGVSRTPRHNQLLPVSRQQQFRINFFIFLSKPVFTILWFSIVIAVSWRLQNFIPDLKLMGHYYTYHRVGVQLIIWALVIIPVFIIFSFAKTYSMVFIGLFCTGIIGVITFLLSIIFIINLHVIMMVLAFILNTLFIALLIWHWFRRDHY